MDHNQHHHETPQPTPEWLEIVTQLNRCDDLVDTLRCLSSLAPLIDEGGERYFRQANGLLFLIFEAVTHLDVAMTTLASTLRAQYEEGAP